MAERWEAVPHGLGELDPITIRQAHTSGEYVAEMRPNAADNPAEVQRRVHLIVAAPELLEAAREFLRHHAQVPDIPISDDNPLCVCGHCARFRPIVARIAGGEEVHHA